MMAMRMLLGRFDWVGVMVGGEVGGMEGEERVWWGGKVRSCLFFFFFFFLCLFLFLLFSFRKLVVVIESDIMAGCFLTVLGLRLKLGLGVQGGIVREAR